MPTTPPYGLHHPLHGIENVANEEDANTLRDVHAVPGIDWADNVQAAREVLRLRSARKVQGLLLDLQTANAIDTVARALEVSDSPNAERNMKLLREKPLSVVGRAVWKMVR